MTTAARTRSPFVAHRGDLVLLAIVGVLVLFGLLAVYSSSFVFALMYFDNPTYLIQRQVALAFLGLIGLLVFSRIDYHRLWRWSPFMMLGALGALVLVLTPFGHTSNGATRWLALGPLPPLQPSEFAKLALVIYLSAWLAGRGDRIQQFWSGLVPFLLLAGVTCGLVLVQPDLGSTLVLAAIAVVLLFVGGVGLHHLALLAAGAGVAAMPLVMAAGYRAARMEAFLDPWKDPRGTGYHIIQSLIALGSGGLTGLGFGASRQKFLYVPGSHTDAIYAIIGEELGFIGCLVLLALFVAFASRGFRIALTAPDRFGALLATGITSWLLVQAILNIGGITKLIPFTGITLPFISYGGTSLAVTMIAVGILLNVSRQCRSS